MEHTNRQQQKHIQNSNIYLLGSHRIKEKHKKLSERHAIPSSTAAKQRKDRQAATMTINEKCRTNCPAFCFDVGVDGFEPPTLCL